MLTQDVWTVIDIDDFKLFRLQDWHACGPYCLLMKRGGVYTKQDMSTRDAYLWLEESCPLPAIDLCRILAEAEEWAAMDTQKTRWSLNDVEEEEPMVAVTGQ